MLSQLCRAKLSLKSPVKIRTDNHASRSSRHHQNLNINENNLDESEDGPENICQLEHCSFCDYRICCLVNNPTFQQQETQNRSPSEITENPAYGLSAKNWLECEQNVTNSEDNNHTTENHEDPNQNRVAMNYMNISTLKSIPECQESVEEEIISIMNPNFTKDQTIVPNLNNNLCLRQQHEKELSQSNELVVENNANSNEVNTKENSSTEKTLSILKQQKKMYSSEEHNPLKNSKLEIKRYQKVPLKKKHSSNHTQDLDNSHSRSNLLRLSQLSEITSVKTEDSIQEWLMRISEWVDSNSWVKDSCDSTDPNSNEYRAFHNESQNDDHVAKLQNESSKNEKIFLNSGKHPTQEIHTNINEVLSSATKQSPANIPMVVMQCSRLHSHIDDKPPFQQTSLPMGTLVTALYQESDWLYILTPHGVKGFITSSNCAPFGTVYNNNESKRPWEPCDFPIPINIKDDDFFNKQQGYYMPTKIPIYNGQKTSTCITMVKMKTNYYNERNFNYTFKSKDSIKTAKTVTDILKSSPEMEINT